MLVAGAVASGLTALIVFALEPLVPSCAAPRLPVAEPVYSADAVYDQVRESTVLAVESAKHAVGMARRTRAPVCTYKKESSRGD